jgi:hypothetical protein|tara:strand:+ start:43 stop:417 length:375 start_codon:yes stop_codon:yes gene_type:complete
MKLWKIALFVVVTLAVASCGPYVKKPVASHIVAVTITGDTILVAIDKIRPNMYRSYYPIYSNYNYYRPYYGQQEYRFRYPDNRGFRTSNENNNNNNNNVKPRPIVESKDISRLDVNAAKVKMKN